MALDADSIDIALEFVGECREGLDAIEPLLVQLETTDDPDHIAAIFRTMHSAKGTALFLELEQIGHLTHVAESLLDLIRKGTIETSPERITVLCRVVDLVREMLDSVENAHTDTGFEDRVDALVAELEARMSDEGGATEAESPGTSTEVEAQADKSSNDAYRPSVKVDGLLSTELVREAKEEAQEQLEAAKYSLMQLDTQSPDREELNAVYRALHTVKGNTTLFGMEHASSLAHGAESLLEEVRSGKKGLSAAVVSTLLSALDAIEAAIVGDQPGATPAEPEAAHNQQPMDADSRMRGNDAGGTAQPSAASPSSEAAAGARAPKASDATPKAASAPTSNRSASIRVDTMKLDDLMNLVGELIIAETTVTHNPDLDGHHFESFQKAALHLNRLTRRLQHIAMSVRMVPIASTFRKMVRVVRDVAAKQSKEVDLVMSGEATEVDKSIVELIGDPLVHMIRNAVDHGIESPDERERLGKPRRGTVELQAMHEGQEVWVTVRDDGGGLKTDRILEKAIERGLLSADEEHSPQDIHRMILNPGFSTAEKVTDVSGRGVGMDVALRNIESMKGKVDIESTPGQGTVFTLRIPLTLAIIEGMLVRIGRTRYTIPLLSIREHVRATKDRITVMADGSELFRLRDELLPIIRVKDLLDVEGGIDDVEKGILLVVQQGRRSMCLLVDEVVGQRQTVVKPVPEYLRGSRALAGCSILHDGDISLILDIEGLTSRRQQAA